GLLVVASVELGISRPSLDRLGGVRLGAKQPGVPGHGGRGVAGDVGDSGEARNIAGALREGGASAGRSLWTLRRPVRIRFITALPRAIDHARPRSAVSCPSPTLASWACLCVRW